MNDGLLKEIADRMRTFIGDGLPSDIAKQIALMPVLASACDIIKISLAKETDLLTTARTYFELGERFHLGWLRSQAKFINSDDHWHNEATNGLVDQLFSCQAGITIRILKDTDGKDNRGKTLLQNWLERNENLAKQFDPLLAELKRAGTIDLPMLVIAEQRLRGLYGG
jgi:glutamate dehydrogenase